MTFAKNRTYGVPEFAGTEVNRHSGKLKGLSRYLQNHYPKYNIITSTAAAAVKSPMGHFRRSQVTSSQVQHHHKYNIITSIAATTVNTGITTATSGLFFFFINTNCLVEQYSDSVNK